MVLGKLQLNFNDKFQIKALLRLKGQVTLEKKTVVNYRHIFKFPVSDVCWWLKVGNFIPWVQVYKKILDDHLPANFSYICPVKPGKYYLYNITDLFQGEINTDTRNVQDLSGELPNGRYRITFTGGTKEDPVAGFASYEIIIFIRTNTDVF
jgi:hypothetical protein